MTLTAATAADKYRPRHTDAPLGLLQARLRECEACELRDAFVCRLTGQLRSVMARPKSAKCALRKWPGESKGDEDPVDWIRSIRETHGAVTPEYRTRQETGIYRPQVTDIRPSSDRVIITIAIGPEWAELLRVTWPGLEAYAKRCNADLVVLEDQTQSWWGLEKFRVRDWAAAYTRTLYVDADCIIRPDCPDLFETVSPGSFAAHNDCPKVPQPMRWLTREWAALLHSQGLTAADRPLRPGIAMNSGVMVASRAHAAAVWTPPEKSMPGYHVDEQSWTQGNVEAANLPIHWLDSRFNTQWYWKTFPEDFQSAWIIHLANCPAPLRLELARRLTVT